MPTFSHIIHSPRFHERADTRPLFCSRLLNYLATGAMGWWGGGVKRFMRTLLLVWSKCRGDNCSEQHCFFFRCFPGHLPAPGGDKLPSPSIKHPSSDSNRDPWTSARAASHLLSCWYHSNDSLAQINQIFRTALYPLLRCVTDVRQTWLDL